MLKLFRALKKTLLITLLLFTGNLLFFPLSVQALSVPPVNFVPQVSIPGSQFQTGASVPLSRSTKSIADYIQAIYNYGIGVVGILSAIILMIAGTIWITAQGNDTKISEAKEWVGAAFTGMALVLLAYMIFRTINPNLVNLKITPVQFIDKETYMDCCGGKTGIERIPVKIDDQGKAYLLTNDASGNPVPATCSSGAAECKTGEVCLSWANDSYQCVFATPNESCGSDGYCLPADNLVGGEIPNGFNRSDTACVTTAYTTDPNNSVKSPGVCFNRVNYKGGKCSNDANAYCQFDHCDDSSTRSGWTGTDCGYNLYCCINLAKAGAACGVNNTGICVTPTYTSGGMVTPYGGGTIETTCPGTKTPVASGAGGLDCVSGQMCCSK